MTYKLYKTKTAIKINNEYTVSPNTLVFVDWNHYDGAEAIIVEEDLTQNLVCPWIDTEMVEVEPNKTYKSGFDVDERIKKYGEYLHHKQLQQTLFENTFTNSYEDGEVKFSIIGYATPSPVVDISVTTYGEKRSKTADVSMPLDEFIKCTKAITEKAPEILAAYKELHPEEASEEEEEEEEEVPLVENSVETLYKWLSFTGQYDIHQLKERDSKLYVKIMGKEEAGK